MRLLPDLRSGLGPFAQPLAAIGGLLLLAAAVGLVLTDGVAWDVLFLGIAVVGAAAFVLEWIITKRGARPRMVTDRSG